jgi:hypothetical protein
MEATVRKTLNSLSFSHCILFLCIKYGTMLLWQCMTLHKTKTAKILKWQGVTLQYQWLNGYNCYHVTHGHSLWGRFWQNMKQYYTYIACAVSYELQHWKSMTFQKAVFQVIPQLKNKLHFYTSSLLYWLKKTVLSFYLHDTSKTSTSLPDHAHTHFSNNEFNMYIARFMNQFSY